MKIIKHSFSLIFCVIAINGAFFSAYAGDLYEEALKEVSIESEAQSANAQFIFRLTNLSRLYIDEHSASSSAQVFSISVLIAVRETHGRPFSEGVLTLRLLNADRTISLKRRKLEDRELDKIVQTISEQEVFSLPEHREEVALIPSIPIPADMDLNSFKIEKWDIKSGHKTVIRKDVEGTAVANVGVVLLDIVKPWLPDARKNYKKK